jgi:diguanylate cyclase (GGDEF)-like protein
MEPKRKKSFLDRYLDSVISRIGKERHVPARVIIYLIVFFSIAFIHGLFHNSELSSILSQVQSIVSVLLVLTAGEIGFRTVVASSFIQIGMIIYYIVAFKDTRSLPGVIIPASTILIISIILLFSRRIIKENKNVLEQKEKLSLLNADIISKELEAVKQNERLTEYNRAMKENEERLYHLVHYDTLTELPNRTKILDRIDLLVSLLSQKSMGFSLFYIDLDHFKRINDSISHQTGDMTLQAVAARLRDIIHPDDMLGRLAGDEFAVIVQRHLKEEELLVYSEGMRHSLSNLLCIAGAEFTVTASIGIAMYPSDGENGMDLIRNAETAMYKAKEFGRNSVQFFRKEMMDDIMRRVKYESGLLMSIQNDELFLVFQPQYHTKTKELRGFETLARWQNEKYGLVSPGQFIPVAEEAGFIVPLGEWILETACMKLNNLLDVYGKDLIMSVNISAVQIMSPSFVNTVKKILVRTKCNPKNLEFEVTESVMIASVDHVIKVLNELKNMGIRIALDDFGTGYSSLSYLRQLPIETLKIDKSFVDNIFSEGIQRQMVGSIISLVHEMDMEVVAEGVDDPRQLQYLNDHHCDFIQGYIWGRPLPEDEVLRLLNTLNE